MTASDPDLERFVAAQHGSYAQALAEIRLGRKQSHWMWYVFPQAAGLGQSDMARRYAIASLAEARAYLAHPVLGARLAECIAALEELETADAQAVFGATDAMKLRSSLTLFALAAPDDRRFMAAIGRWFDGVPDPRTVALLGAE